MAIPPSPGPRLPAAAEDPPTLFGPFALHARARRLTASGETVRIGDRSLQVLAMLVARAGELVDKKEILDTVWSDSIVTEDSLVQAVREIRRALDDDPKEPRFVKTVHRRGYVFVAPVERGTADAPASAPPLDAPFPAAPPAAAGGDSVPPRDGHRYVLAAALALVAAAPFLLWALLPARRPHEELAERGGGTRYRRLAGLPPGAVKPCASPDGSLVSFVAPDPARRVHSLHVLNVATGAVLQLTRGIEVRGPAPLFRPDGRAILFTSYRVDPGRGETPDVWEVPVEGGAPRLVAREASAASLSPDGASMAVSRVTRDGTSLVVVGPAGEREVASTGYWPRFSPDGASIAYTTSNPEGGNGELLVVRPDGTGQRRLTTLPAQLYGLSWTPASDAVVFAADLNDAFNIWIAPLDGGAPRLLVDGPVAVSSPSIWRGALLFAEATILKAVSVSGLGREPSRPVTVPDDTACIALSPDGKRLAAAAGGTGRLLPVTLLDLSTSQESVLSAARDLSVHALRWAPDGRSLLLVAGSRTLARPSVWRAPVQGGPLELLLGGEAEWTSADLSPDGRRIAAVRRAAEGSGDELVVGAASGGGEQLLARASAVENIRFSPDGRSIAWSGADRQAGFEGAGVWLAPAGGGAPRRVAADGRWPAWEPGGLSLLLARGLENLGTWRVRAGGGPPELVRRAEGGRNLWIEQMDLSRDGRTLALFVIEVRTAFYVKELRPGV